MRVRYAVLALGLLCLALCGCTGSTEPVVFPNEGRTGPGSAPGSTAAVMIDSNYIPLVDLDEWHDLSPERVQVWILDAQAIPPDFEVEANVRAVFDLRPDEWSELGLTQRGVWGAVALFDLPSDDALGNPTYPHDVTVEVRIVSPPKPPGTGYAQRIAAFTLRGKDGEPQELLAEAQWPGQEGYWLQRRTQPAVRLRAKRSAFQPGDVIGSIEFDFRFNVGGFTDCVSSVSAAKQVSEATGVALVGPTVSESQKVVLVSPDGFELTFIEPPLAFDDTLAGEGPFLDLLIEEGVGACDLTVPGWFEISNLRVTDLDGAVLFSEGTVGVDQPEAPDPAASLRAYLVDPTG